MIASPLATLALQSQGSLADAIVRIVKERSVERVIVGLPVKTDGTEGTACLRSRAFARRLAARGIDIELWDERYSSIAAEDALRGSGLSRKKTAARVDAVAAALILTDYLAYRSRVRSS